MSLYFSSLRVAASTSRGWKRRRRKHRRKLSAQLHLRRTTAKPPSPWARLHTPRPLKDHRRPSQPNQPQDHPRPEHRLVSHAHLLPGPHLDPEPWQQEQQHSSMQFIYPAKICSSYQRIITQNSDIYQRQGSVVASDMWFVAGQQKKNCKNMKKLQ